MKDPTCWICKAFDFLFGHAKNYHDRRDIAAASLNHKKLRHQPPEVKNGRS